MIKLIIISIIIFAISYIININKIEKILRLEEELKSVELRFKELKLNSSIKIKELYSRIVKINKDNIK